jgi:ATP-dependent RNA helicase RhlE
MPDEIRSLARELLREPLNVEVSPRRSAPAAGVRQMLLPVAAGRKRDLLAHLLATEARGLTLVFTRTKHGANKLARDLEGRGHSVAVLHGNRSQAQRTKALASFRGGRSRVMVATDIAGRGIDVDGIGHVVNFDLPNVPEDYVHRIGRTARAGAVGHALSLVSPEDQPHVRGIEALIGRSIERRVVQEFAAGPTVAPAAQRPAGSSAPGSSAAGSWRGNAQPSRFGSRPPARFNSQPPSRFDGGSNSHGSRRRSWGGRPAR